MKLICITYQLGVDLDLSHDYGLHLPVLSV